MDPARPITYGIVQPGPHVPDGVPYVRVVDMQDGTVLSQQLRRTSADIAKAYRRASIIEGDLLVSIRGHVGRTAIVPSDASGANLTQDTARVAVSAVAEARYVRRFIESPLARHWMAQHTKGVAVTGISLTDLRQLPVPLPHLDEQRRVADVLDKADGIRRKRKEAMALTDELLRSTFMELVGPGARHYSGWPLVRLEALAARTPGSIRTGPFGSDLKHSEFVDEGVVVLGIDNAVQNAFGWGERRFITSAKYEALRRYTVHPGDVLVTIMGTTGRSAVVPDDIPLAITTKHLATLTLDRGIAEPEFVSQAMHRHPVVLRQIAQSNRGAIMSGLNLGLIRSLEVPLPPLGAQRAFGRATLQIRTIQARIETGLQGAEQLFDSLASRAFIGELGSASAAGKRSTC